MSDNSKTVFIFPGQGSQYVGIGSDLYGQHDEVKQVYEQASDVLGYDMAVLSFEDPKNEINLTRYTQPVLLTHAYACLQIFKKQTGNRISPDITAGHSLGEYSALVAANVLTFNQALKLVSKRGELMGEFGEGEMEALPLAVNEARELAEKYFCAVAACNLKDQTVVGGSAGDLDKVVADLAENYPKKRSARLKTEGAFHTYYMVEAAKRFREVLDTADFTANDNTTVLSNYTGKAHQTNADSIRSRLFLQLFYPVMWLQNLKTAADLGGTTFVEFGGGIGKGETPAEKRGNLEGIIKKAFRGSEITPVYHGVINTNTLIETTSKL